MSPDGENQRFAIEPGAAILAGLLGINAEKLLIIMKHHQACHHRGQKQPGKNVAEREKEYSMFLHEISLPKSGGEWKGQMCAVRRWRRAGNTPWQPGGNRVKINTI